MNGDRTHDGAQVALQIRGRDGRKNRSVAFRREHGAPLEISRLRTRNGRSFRVRGCGGPGAPRVVWRFGIAGPREELDLTASRKGTVPAQRAPGRDGLRIARFRLVRAATGALG